MKPHAIATKNGTYLYDAKTGMYEPIEAEPFLRPGLIIISLCLLGWAAFGGLAYCIYRAVGGLT